MRQSGITVIEDDVEIQAHSAIDRATVGETRIGRGTKIDNLVQVGHACKVGEDTLLCGQVGLAGTTRVGKSCILAGQVGAAGHLTIGDGAVLTAQTRSAGRRSRRAQFIRDIRRWRIWRGENRWRCSIACRNCKRNCENCRETVARIERVVSEVSADARWMIFAGRCVLRSVPRRAAADLREDLRRRPIPDAPAQFVALVYRDISTAFTAGTKAHMISPG